MAGKEEFRNIRVQPSSEKSSTRTIYVENLGDVTIVETPDEESRPIWQAVHKSSQFIIYASEPFQLKMTYHDMLESKWSYELVDQERVKLHCICLKRLVRAKKTPKKSKKVKTKVTTAHDLPALFLISEEQNEHEGVYESVQEQTKIQLTIEEDIDFDQDHEQDMHLETGDPNYQSGFSQFSVLNQESDEESQHSNEDYHRWFANVFEFTFSNNDDGWANNFFNSAEENDFEDFFNQWKGPISQTLSGINNFSTLEGLKSLVSDNNKRIVIALVEKDTTGLLVRRYTDFEPEMSHIPYFYDFCFMLLAKNQLDVGQLCDVLEFFRYQDRTQSPSFIHSYNALLKDEQESEWFLNVKEGWLQREFASLNLANTTIDFLIEFPWTTAVYKFFIEKFHKELVSMDLADRKILKPLPLTNSNLILDLVLKSNGFKDFKAKLEFFTRSRDLCLLCKDLGLPGVFNNLSLLINNLTDNTHLLDEVRAGIPTKHNFHSKQRNKLIGLIYHGCNYSLRESEVKNFVESIKHGEDADVVYQKNIIDAIFNTKKQSLDNIDVVAEKICSNEGSQIKSLILEFKLFGTVSKTIEKEKKKRLSDASSCGDEVFSRYKNDFEEICTLRVTQDTPFMIFSNHKKLHRILRILKLCFPEFEVRTVQLATIIYMLFYPDPEKKGVLAQIFTGEGKTMIVAVIAAYYGLQKLKVDIFTSSIELSIPQMKQYTGFFEELDLSVAALDNGKPLIPYADIDILYATSSSYIREQLNDDDPLKKRQQFKRQVDVCIIDEVDNMLFDGSSGLVQLSSIETTALMPIYYSLLTKIYYKVIEGYSGFPANPEKLSFQQEENLLLDYLKSMFRIPLTTREDCPADRVQSILSLNKITLFNDPNFCINGDLYSVDLDRRINYHTVLDFDYKRMFYIDHHHNLKISNHEIAIQIEECLQRNHVQSIEANSAQFKVMRSNLTDVTQSTIVYCMSIEVAEILAQLKICVNDIKYNIVPLKVKTNPVVGACFSHPNMLKKDLEQAFKVAIKLDKDQKLKIGWANVLQTFEQQKTLSIKEKLDLVIGYLRKVHYFSYYTATHYPSISELLKAELYPCMRDNRPLNEIILIKESNELEEKIKKFMKKDSSHGSLLVRKLKNSYLQAEYCDIIRNFPSKHAGHALLQFDIWVENCYKVIMYYSINVGYIRNDQTGKNIKIDDGNTGVLQENTQLMDGLQQFLSLKENSILDTGSLTSSLKGITEFYRSYKKIYGLTGTIGDKETVNFLTSTYQVSTFKAPSHFADSIKEARSNGAFYRCFEYPGLVFNNENDWLNAIIESTKQHILFGRPVLVFCQSVRILKGVFVKHFRKRFPTLTIWTYDAISELQATTLEKPVIILATNIAGRGTDFKLRNTSMKSRGGLHVCLTYLPKNRRVELQCVGRTARSGDKGSAQLILYDNCGKSRTVTDLRGERDEKVKYTIQRARKQVIKLEIAEILYQEFLDSLKGIYFKILESRERQNVLSSLRYDWDRDYVPGLRYKFKNEAEKGTENFSNRVQYHKKSFLGVKIKKYAEAKTKDVENAFINEAQLKSNESYNKYQISSMKQAWAFWMKKFFWSKGDDAPFLVSKEALKSLKNKHKKLIESLDDAHRIIGHSVFVARETFMMLLNKEVNRTTRADLENLFQKYSIHIARNKEKFMGLCLYYYAGFLFKKLTYLSNKEKQSEKTKQKLKEIKDILIHSKHLIETEIVQLFNDICIEMHPTRLVYIQLDGIKRIFEHLVMLIAKQIGQFDQVALNKAAIPYVYRLIEVEQYGFNIKVDIGMNPSTVTEAITNHCKSFGYFGFASFIFAEYHPKVMRTIIKPHLKRVTKEKVVYDNQIITKAIPRGELTYWQRIRSFFGKKFFRAEGTIEHIKVTEFVNGQSLVCRLDNSLNVDLTSAKTRMEMQLTIFGKRSNPSQAGPRAMLMHLQTQQGVSKVEPDQHQALLDKSPLERNNDAALNVTQVNTKDLGILSNNIRKHIEAFAENINNHIMMVEEKYFSHFKKLADQYSDFFLPVFLVDNYHNYHRHEEEQRKILEKTISFYRKQILKKIKSSIHSKKEEKRKICVTWYLETIKKAAGAEQRIALDLVQILYDNSNSADYTLAGSSSREFYFDIANGFLRDVRNEVDKSFRKKAKAEMRKYRKEKEHLTSLFNKRVETYLEGNVRKQKSCICCNPNISFAHKLQNISNAFNLAIDFYCLPLHTKLFIPESSVPRGAERVTFYTDIDGDTEALKPIWTVKDQNKSCLIELLSIFYDIEEDNGLELLTKGIDEAEKDISGVPDRTTYDEDAFMDLKLSWHEKYPNKKDLIKIVNEEKFLSTSSLLVGREGCDLEGLHITNQVN